jgi:hypothetical protein
MAHSTRHAAAALVRRLTACRNDAGAAASLGARHLSGSSAVQHVQPVPVDDAHAAGPSKSRWLAELGAVRNDWT